MSRNSSNGSAAGRELPRAGRAPSGWARAPARGSAAGRRRRRRPAPRARPSARGRRCGGPGWRCRRGVATSCSSTQLPSTPEQRRRLVDRQVGVRAAVRDDREVLPGVEPEAGHHPADEVDAVARQHAEVVAGPVRRCPRAGRSRRAGWSARRACRPCRDQLAVGPDLRGARLVGDDHRVGDLPVGQRDRQPRAGRGRRPPTSAGQAERGGERRPTARRARRGRRRRSRRRRCPRRAGGRRRPPCAASCVVEQGRARPGRSRPTRCCRSRTRCRRRRRPHRRPRP